LRKPAPERQSLSAHRRAKPEIIFYGLYFSRSYAKISLDMIAQNFDEAFAQVKSLSERFRRDESEYLKPAYQEAEVRQDFLDKFFVALGWDVYHQHNSNPYEREVRIEKSVMVQGRGKRADYAFYTAPNFSQPRFMAEAKKPSRQLENAQDCFQAIRYGWNSNTPISVLTDFEQFLVLDSRYKPSVETAAQRIIREKSFRFTDYADEEKFREIYYLFSREAVGNNSLENFAANLKGGRGAKKSKIAGTAIIQPIDEEFLAELDEQRLNLARAFKNRNPELDGEILTEITQRTLDRMVFLRFLEDKLVEPDAVIDNLGKRSGSAWRDFIGEMPRLNQIYNGTLFRTHTILDRPDFAPDERAFAETRDWLAQANSPYDFNSIPIHILGSIYERFLGKTIETTDKRATVVDKPEVRKAGGVYYTPEYIVRYIVENTIGKLIENKKPEEIAQMRFADIACGSGSFLLGVFDHLIAYHVEYFSENKTRRERAVKDGLCRETVEGVLQLTIQYKREILLNNIYGVDLDAQAVEVAQLSLYLKLLEEETTATKQQFLTGFREQLLPSLNKNIVHGNSLIDYDIMDGMLFDTRELKQLNPMNFASTFPEVFQNGGFDAIVGNPPYRMLQPHNTEKPVIEHLKKNYVAAEFKIELFHLFLQKGISLIKNNGKLGFIIPTTILNNVYAESLRNWILNQTKIDSISVAKGRVFADADVHTSVLIFTKDLENTNQLKNEILITSQLDNLFAAKLKYEARTLQKTFFNLQGKVWNILINSHNTDLITKLIKNYVSLGDWTKINRGLITGDRSKYFSDVKISDNHVPIIAGSDVQRYFVKPFSEFVLFERPKTSGGCWDKEVHFALNKIVIRQIGEKPTASILKEPIAVTGNIFTIRGKSLEEELYLVGIINSKLAEFYWRIMFADFKTSFPQVTIFSLSQLPIRTIDFSNPQEKAAHDKMVELVEKMLEAKKQLAAAQTDRDRSFFERFCASLDRQIDALVYELYDLTPEEIKIVESKG
jgi:adenine-specific DNA-methyltransferase